MLLACLEVLREGFFCFPVRDWEGDCRKLLSLVFLNFQLLPKMLNLIFIKVTCKLIGLSEVIKFCTRKLINRTHIIPPLKKINLFQDMIPNVSPQKCGS